MSMINDEDWSEYWESIKEWDDQRAQQELDLLERDFAEGSLSEKDYTKAKELVLKRKKELHFDNVMREIC